MFTLRTKRIILVSAIIGLALILGWWLRRRYQVAPSAPISSAAAQAAKEKALIKSVDDSLDQIAKTDRDLDGLPDSEEKTLGANPNFPDTDGDGLLDGLEVKTYQTNPLKSDTYGLGHSDGWAVQHGVILLGGKTDRSKLPKSNP